MTLFHKKIIFFISIVAISNIAYADCAKFSLEKYAENTLSQKEGTPLLLTGDLNGDNHDDVITYAMSPGNIPSIYIHYSDSEGRPGGAQGKAIPYPLNRVYIPGNKDNFSRLYHSSEEDAFHIGPSGKVTNHSIIRITKNYMLEYYEIPFNPNIYHDIQIGRVDGDEWIDAIALDKDNNLFATWGTEGGFTAPKLIAQKVISPNKYQVVRIGGQGVIVAQISRYPDPPAVTILEYYVKDFNSTPSLARTQTISVPNYINEPFQKMAFVTGFGQALVIGNNFFIRTMVNPRVSPSIYSYVYSQLSAFPSISTFADLNGDGADEAIYAGPDGLIRVAGQGRFHKFGNKELPETWNEITSIGIGKHPTQILAGTFRLEKLAPSNYWPDELVVYSEDNVANSFTLTYLRAVCAP